MRVHPKNIIRFFLILILLAGSFGSLSATAPVSAADVALEPAGEVTAYELIIAMNQLRMSYGLSALIEDPIINAVAQSTAQIMADNQMSWHIGDVSGRLQSAGYGGGAKVWGTENFAVGNPGIDEIMVMWADPSHMIPAVNPAYCHVGAGTARSANGMTYFVLQAAYTSSNSCGEYKAPDGWATAPASGNPGGSKNPGVPGFIVPVKIATPDADGNIYHVVQAGQSFWAIAIAYQVTIKDIETWNNISKDSKLQIGQKLLIPGPNTKGFATPTPMGMILLAQPDKDGKVIHEVQAYQTLSTIGSAYKVEVNTILALNGIQEDWPLQIGQKLVIEPSKVTPSPTPRPLTPVEKLTPAADGKYYHTVQSGETLSWIAGLYEVQLDDLMMWNKLNANSILFPDQKLLLQVTPPATITPTPEPATATPTITNTLPATATQTLEPTKPATPTPTPEPADAAEAGSIMFFALVGLVAASGVTLAIWAGSRNK